jgi:hypothetical protein
MRRSVLRWANNYQLSPTTSLATYLPLRKNIIFHKLIASMVFLAACVCRISDARRGVD